MIAADLICYRHRMSLADPRDSGGFTAARLPAAVFTARRPGSHWTWPGDAEADRQFWQVWRHPCHWDGSENHTGL